MILISWPLQVHWNQLYLELYGTVLAVLINNLHENLSENDIKRVLTKTRNNQKRPTTT